MITEERLKELERLEKAVESAPWIYSTWRASGQQYIRWGIGTQDSDGELVSGQVLHGLIHEGHKEETYQFIAACRNALPDLISTIRTLRAENEGLKELAKTLEGMEAVTVTGDQAKMLNPENNVNVNTTVSWIVLANPERSRHKVADKVYKINNALKVIVGAKP